LLVSAVKTNPYVGSTTAVMARLEENKIVTCNLGDSCYLILRSSNGDLTTVHRSKEQTYSFNFPY